MEQGLAQEQSYSHAKVGNTNAGEHTDDFQPRHSFIDMSCLCTYSVFETGKVNEHREKTLTLGHELLDKIKSYTTLGCISQVHIIR